MIFRCSPKFPCAPILFGKVKLQQCRIRRSAFRAPPRAPAIRKLRSDGPEAFDERATTCQWSSTAAIQPLRSNPKITTAKDDARNGRFSQWWPMQSRPISVAPISSHRAMKARSDTVSQYPRASASVSPRSRASPDRIRLASASVNGSGCQRISRRSPMVHCAFMRPSAAWWLTPCKTCATS